MRKRLDNFIDSYDHYRGHVGLGRLRSALRAIHYEITGRDQWEI